MTTSSLDSRGAYTVELMLTLLVFLVILFSFFEFGRILAVRMVLLKGAQDGLSVAEKIPGAELETRTLQLPRDQAQVNALNRARQAVADAASRAPGSLVTQYGGQGTRFAGFQYPDVPTYPANGVVQAAYLRPGERVTMLVDGQTVRSIPHPRPAPASVSWATILETEPVMVINCARLPLLFLRGDSLLCGRALGFRPPSAEVLPTSPAAPVTPIPPCSPIDCAASPPKTVYDPGTCNCVCPTCQPPRTQQDPITCDCSCPPTPVCSSPYLKDPNTCNCYCPLTPANCTPALPNFDAPNCRCTCPHNENTCAPRVFNPATCSCQCAPYGPCTGNFVDDPTNCRCTCSLTAATCQAQNKILDPTSCSCICDPAQQAQCVATGGTWNASTCTCTPRGPSICSECYRVFCNGRQIRSCASTNLCRGCLGSCTIVYMGLCPCRSSGCGSTPDGVGCCH